MTEAGSKAMGSFILYWKSAYVQMHTHGKKSKPGTHTSNKKPKEETIPGLFISVLFSFKVLNRHILLLKLKSLQGVCGVRNNSNKNS